MKSHSSYRFSYIYHIVSVWFLGILLHSIWIVMLLLHLKADKELNIWFVLRIFLQIIAVLALLEFHIALAALDDRTCRTCGKYSLQGQQVRSSLHSPAQGPRDFPDVSSCLISLMMELLQFLTLFMFHRDCNLAHTIVILYNPFSLNTTDCKWDKTSIIQSSIQRIHRINYLWGTDQ